ncbi:tectonic-like complex member MKS1 [Lineus longissimus]|uniref:tectonic-like complex member MKS1 n=1 Tax=Lineus longissimus TaxID=88925 RepID=UPI002B4E1D1C
MADLYDPDYGTAYYRSRDPVKNIRIRVNLERVTSASMVPQAATDQGGLQDFGALDFGGKKDGEIYVFEWQEKVFSEREVILYTDEANCPGVLERKYNKEVKNLRSKRPTKRLFTYTDHDTFTAQEQMIPKMTTSVSDEQSALAKKVTTVRKRKNFGRGRDSDKAPIPKTNLIDSDPSEEKKLKTHIVNRPVKTMYIMADVSPEDAVATEDDEAILCTIQVDNSGVVSVSPDFNRGRKAYRVETQSLGKDAFEYTVDHVSRTMNRQEQNREIKMFRELYTRHTDFLQSVVGNEFEMPPPDVLRVLVYGEILSAKNFEYDDLYIHYFCDLPRNWYAAGTEQLSGVTHTCTTKIEGRDNIAFFSFPFYFELFYKNDTVNPLNRDLMPTWPTFYMEVLSIDNWQRYRTEGYAYQQVPSSPGRSFHKINCWRPVGNSVIPELRRFFIGGSPELEDPTYASTPTGHNDTLMSKYGFKTESTGEVTIRMHSIQQSRANVDKSLSKKKVGSLIDRLGGQATQNSIMGVIDAFKKAREKMMATRESLQYLKELKLDDEDKDIDEQENAMNDARDSTLLIGTVGAGENA